MFKFKRKSDKPKSVTLRFQGKEYTLLEGYFFKPDLTITVTGAMVGRLETRKDLSIEVVSID